MPNFGILAHYHERTARPTNFIPREVALLMLERLVAEKISQRVIRLFPPGSHFNHILPKVGVYIPETLSVHEYGTKFQEPRSPNWQADHGVAGRALRARAGLTLKAWRKTVRSAF